MIINLISFIRLVSELYSGALVIYALLSWFPGAYDSSLGRFLSKICDPYLRIFDRLNLNFGGISFSIMVALLALNFGTEFVVRLIVKLYYIF
ncbi:YggT family protein [Vagococcus sp. PNs007]|uniref:YggT family protein n=2 Tax=Vagococcus TaxID=2737 RepID=A0A430A7T7_9ENTE|nr:MULTISPECIES: YggT family protein [Vagococcus]MDF0479434.1 YggT family protein [Vagococcus proximus]RSU03193.1 YggT family protein [Vagococcus fessus]